MANLITEKRKKKLAPIVTIAIMTGSSIKQTMVRCYYLMTKTAFSKDNCTVKYHHNLHTTGVKVSFVKSWRSNFPFSVCSVVYSKLCNWNKSGNHSYLLNLTFCALHYTVSFWSLVNRILQHGKKKKKPALVSYLFHCLFFWKLSMIQKWNYNSLWK